MTTADRRERLRRAQREWFGRKPGALPPRPGEPPLTPVTRRTVVRCPRGDHVGVVVLTTVGPYAVGNGPRADGFSKWRSVAWGELLDDAAPAELDFRCPRCVRDHRAPVADLRRAILRGASVYRIPPGP